MNVYLENSGLFRTFYLLIKCKSRIPAEKGGVHLHLRSRRFVAVASLYLIGICFPWIKMLTLDISASKLTPMLAAVFNRKPGLTIRLLVDKPLTFRQWKRISSIDGRIVIYDSMDESAHENLYAEERRVVYTNSRHAGIEEADAFALVSGMMPIECTFSSCLGKTMYISKDGKISYCPRYPEKTVIGSVGSIENIFDHPLFRSVLKETIVKRRQCSEHCTLFTVCRSGCPVRFDCMQFQKRFMQAAAAIQQIEEEKQELSSLPLYQEYAVCYDLFGLKKK